MAIPRYKKSIRQKTQGCGPQIAVLIFFSVLMLIIAPWLIFPILFFAFVYGAVRKGILKSTKNDFGFLGNEEDFIKSILALAAYLTKADRKISTTERKYIQRELADDFTEKYAARYMQVYEDFLKKKLSVRKICMMINANFDPAAKIQLLHFLVGLIVSDGILTKTEEHKIYTICKLIRMPYSSLRSIFAMYRFKQESQQSRQSGYSSGNRNQRTSNSSQLSNAYHILGISETASADQIKKAYRKLAKIHHPDKVAHLGEHYQFKAKEKFQQIVDAYDLICEKRGIK